MIAVNYKSKRKLKKAIGEMLKYENEYAVDNELVSRIVNSGTPFFVSNVGRTFRATVTVIDGRIAEVK